MWLGLVKNKYEETITTSLLLCSILLSQDSSLNVEKDELVLEVNGMVCGMCAFGIQEGLSELSFLNNKKFEEDGIEVDLDTQMIYIPIDLSKRLINLKQFKSLKMLAMIRFLFTLILMERV